MNPLVRLLARQENRDITLILRVSPGNRVHFLIRQPDSYSGGSVPMSALEDPDCDVLAAVISARLKNFPCID